MPRKPTVKPKSVQTIVKHGWIALDRNGKSIWDSLSRPVRSLESSATPW
jgi:hypothetical protein